MVKYISTRGGEEILTSAQAIIKGIANDGGLYVPESIPVLKKKPGALLGMNYREIAFLILSEFFTDYTEQELRNCIDNAYDSKFESREIVPLVKAGNAWFLELYHGKTAAFKDMALSILPYLLTTALRKEREDKKIAILVATSGDTGKAALEGFADVQGTEIVVFYPKDGVSQVQAMQMITQEGKNTHVFSIEGNFDDAQTGVKRIFNNKELSKDLAEKGYKLSSANSINIGRLVPQIAYYVWSYVKLIEQGAIRDGEKINVVVPTGNFGNILASYYAKEMGLPIDRFICASNKNKVLTDFINTGIYDSNRDFHVTSSPSMDILISSNLERLLYILSNNDGERISVIVNELNRDKKYEIDEPMRRGLKDFYGGFANEKETYETIGNVYRKEAYLMDTHTAVGYKVYQEYRNVTGDVKPTVIASTASPYKFAVSVAKAIGLSEEGDGFSSLHALNRSTRVKIPLALEGLENKQIRHNKILKISELEKAVKSVLT